MGRKVVPELACYYGDKSWLGSDALTNWVKSLLLFFDGIATQYPSDDFNRLVDSDPVLALPLVESGLLVNYAPNEQSPVPKAFDPASGEFTSEFKKIIKPILPLLEAVFERSTAASIHPQSAFDSLHTALSADTLRQTVTNVAIQPVTDDEAMAQIVASFLVAYANASKTRVIVSDLTALGVDFSAVPLDEVLDFRRQHGSEYRSYAKDLRSFTLDLSLMGEEEQTLAMAERVREFEDTAEALRRLTRRAFARSATALAFGIAGAELSSQGEAPFRSDWTSAATCRRSSGDSSPILRIRRSVSRSPVWPCPPGAWS